MDPVKEEPVRVGIVVETTVAVEAVLAGVVVEASVAVEPGAAFSLSRPAVTVTGL